MTQTGIITKILDNGLADVAVERVTACSHCSRRPSIIFMTFMLSA